jgi:hypothetical protein
VLLALAPGRSHGYAVMGFVDQLTDRRSGLARDAGSSPMSRLANLVLLTRLHHTPAAAPTS